MSYKKLGIVITGIVLVGVSLSPLSAKTLRPLETEDANTLPEGQVDLHLSMDYVSGYVPLFNLGVRDGEYYELPRMGANIGISDNVEVQVDWVMLKINNSLHDEYGPGDPRLFAKINIMKEDGYIPALGFRFGVKIPSADDQKGLGTNDFDFFAVGLVSKEIGPVSAHLNWGMAILGDPHQNTGQDDLFTYNLAVIYPVVKQFSLAGEIDGQTNSRRNNDTAVARVGFQYNIADFTLDGSFAAGLNNHSENFRIGAGLTYHWKAF